MREPKANFFYGILLGILVGFLDGNIGLIIWGRLGCPDFFIRQGHEGVHVHLMAICGGVAGVAYGALLNGIASCFRRVFRYRCIYLVVMAMSVLVFSVSHYWVIKNQVPLTKVIANSQLFVFGLAVVAAVSLSKRDISGKPMAADQVPGNI